MSQYTMIPECVALHTLRWINGINEEDLAGSLSMSRGLLSKYQTVQAPPSEALDAILEKIGFERQDFEDLASSLTRIQTRHRMARQVASPVDPTPEEASDIEARALAMSREAEHLAREIWTDAIRSANIAKARAEAQSICDRLENDPKPRLAVEKVMELRTWAVAERLAHRSAEVAVSCAGRAKELSALACRVAELSPYEGPFRESLLGYTMAFRENALRAAGEIPEAEVLFAQAEAHWLAGSEAPGPLQAWRLAGLAGSLHRDQGRFDEALSRLDGSLADAPDEGRGRLLVMKSLTLQQMGEAEKALKLLDQAEHAAAREGDRQSVLIACFNRTRLLCVLGRFGDAELRLRELEAVAEELGSGMIQIRLRWLRASVDAGLGRWAEAAAILDAARQELTDRKAAWECAWVSLELAVLLCRSGRTHEVQTLARGLTWIVEDKRLSLAARSAVRLLQAEAESNGLSLAAAQRALHLLERAPKADPPPGPKNPDLSTASAAGTGGGRSAPLADRKHKTATAPAARIKNAAAL